MEKVDYIKSTPNTYREVLGYIKDRGENVSKHILGKMRHRTCYIFLRRNYTTYSLNIEETMLTNSTAIYNEVFIQKIYIGGE